MKICLVTTEYPGVCPSGGIGTYVYELGNLLKSEHEVTILVVSEHARLKKNQECEIKFVSVNDIKGRIFSGGTLLSYKFSLTVFDWLKEQNFDHINFPDWLGLGFASLQGKETGIAFQQTTISITLHGITAWTMDQDSFPKVLNVEENKVHFMETYSIEKADLVISPSNYMKDWISNLGIRTKHHVKVIYNPLLTPEISINEPSVGNIKRVVFLGRIERRKGIEEFLAALDLLENTQNVEVLFMGRSVFGYSPIDLDSLNKRFLNAEKYENLSTSQALSMLNHENTLVVIPSLIENCPYVIQEVASLNLRVLAANVGGIPELIPSSNLVEPDSESIARRVQGFLLDSNSIPKSYSLISIASSQDQWLEVFREVLPKSLESRNLTPKIGIVVAHYNQSNFLESALLSISTQTYSNFEVIVIDDGSSESHSKRFESIAINWRSRGFKFIQQENHDVGFTRNRGVKELEVEIVCFLDADDLLDSRALEFFAKAICAGADIATTHFSIFLDESNPVAGDNDLYGCYEPMGPIINAMWQENVLGGANFAVRKDVFQKLGGFTEIRRSNHQDWQLLTKAVLQEIDLRVIPERLLFYRVIPNSMARSRSHLEGTLEVIDRFTENAPAEKMRQVLNELMKNQLTSSIKDEKVQLVSSTFRLAQRLRAIALRFAPYGSWRWKTLLPLFRRIVK